MAEIKMLRSYGDYEEGEIYEVSIREKEVLTKEGWATFVPPIPVKIVDKRKIEKVEIKEVKKEFVCPICGYSAKSRGWLTRHMKTHDKDKEMKPSRRISPYKTK